MRFLHRIGLTIIDKLILVLCLFLVSLDVTAGFTEIGWDFVTILIGVTLAYMGVVLFVEFVTFFFRTEGRGVGLVKGIVSALLIWLLFPKVLAVIFWLAGSTITGYTETVLLWTFIIRAFVGAWLGRRWATVGD